MKHELVDIGANLVHDSFDDDRDDVLRRAADVGVATLIVGFLIFIKSLALIFVAASCSSAA